MILPKNEVTVFTLANILKNAFFEIDDIQEDRFIVKSESIFFFVRVEPKNDRIELYLYHNPNDIEYSQEVFLKTLIACNEANTNRIFITTRTTNFDNKIFLCFERTIRYDKGLNIAQFVSDIKIFDTIVMTIVRNEFKGIF